MGPSYPATILNVDDDETGRYASTRALQRAGYTVLEAATGAEALRLVAETPPDLVLLDVHLPDMSGVEVCRRIKSDPATALIPVVHLSATTEESGSVAKGLEAGADAFLIKPLQAHLLLAMVQALLRTYRTEKERVQLLAEVARQNALLDAVTSQMPAGLVVVDASGKLLLRNDQAAHLLGRPVMPGATIERCPPDMVHHADGRPYDPKELPIARSLRTGEQVVDERMVVTRGDGRGVSVLVSSAPLRNPDGAIIGAIGVFREDPDCA